MKESRSVFIKLLFVALWTITFTSCATMISGFKADVFIDGNIDEPMTISSSGGTYEDVTLPTVVEVKRRQLNGQHIQICSEHYTFDDIVIEKTLNEWALLSAFSYGMPLCIDLLTNAVSKPKHNQFLITPIESIAAADSLSLPLPKSVVPSSTMDFVTKTRLRSQRFNAKFPRHEINATLGVGSNQADRLTKRFVDDIVQRNHMEREGECGDIFGDSYFIGKIEYHYRLNKKWEVGAMMAWGKSSEDYTDEYYYMTEQQIDDYPKIITLGYQSCHSISFAPSVRYTWYEKGACRYYSRAACGLLRDNLSFDMNEWAFNDPYQSYCYADKKKHFEKTEWRLAYQLSPFCMSIGAGPVRLVAELGYGCLGVCNVGLGICF